MLDRIVAPIALATLAIYVGIIAFNVPKPALIAVIVVVLALAARDFWSQLFREGE